MNKYYVPTICYGRTPGKYKSASLYELTVDRNVVTLTKLEIVAGESEVPVGIGWVLDGNNKDDGFLGIIDDSSLTIYHTTDKEPHPFSDANTRGHIGSVTACFPGIFASREEAKLCLAHRDLNCWDKRFQNETKIAIEELRKCGAIVLDTLVASGQIIWQEPYVPGS